MAKRLSVAGPREKMRIRRKGRHSKRPNKQYKVKNHFG